MITALEFLLPVHRRVVLLARCPPAGSRRGTLLLPPAQGHPSAPLALKFGAHFTIHHDLGGQSRTVASLAAPPPRWTQLLPQGAAHGRVGLGRWLIGPLLWRSVLKLPFGAAGLPQPSRDFDVLWLGAGISSEGGRHAPLNLPVRDVRRLPGNVPRGIFQPATIVLDQSHETGRPVPRPDTMSHKEIKMADRETIIDTGGGGGAGAIIAGILIVAVLVIAFFVFFNNGGSRTVDVDVPAVTVDVAPDGQ